MDLNNLELTWYYERMHGVGQDFDFGIILKQRGYTWDRHWIGQASVEQLRQLDNIAVRYVFINVIDARRRDNPEGVLSVIVSNKWHFMAISLKFVEISNVPSRTQIDLQNPKDIVIHIYKCLFILLSASESRFGEFSDFDNLFDFASLTVCRHPSQI